MAGAVRVDTLKVGQVFKVVGDSNELFVFMRFDGVVATCHPLGDTTDICYVLYEELVECHE